MFAYNLKLAITSLNDRIGLTVLMVLAIGVGLGLLMTMHTMAHQTNKVPVPHISQKLHMIKLDNRELSADEVNKHTDMVNLTYQDTMNLYVLNSSASSQTYHWNTNGILNVEDTQSQSNVVKPFRASFSATTYEFFSLFDVPFLYGSEWSAETDDAGLARIVLSKRSNQRLFAGENSVGKTVRIGTQELVISGVLDDWFLASRFYDGSFFNSFPDDAFIPSAYAFNNDMPRRAFFNCWSDEDRAGRFADNDLAELKRSECGWMTLWTRFDSQQAVDEYKDTLNQYVQSQKQLGRFPRPVNNFVTNINDQLDEMSLGGGWLEILQTVGSLFFVVCIINAISILLAKFMRRVKEVSLRRALGAKRKTLMQQYVIEVCLIGVMGGLFGILVAYFGLEAMIRINHYGMDYVVPIADLRPYYVMDWVMIARSFAIALGSALIVGLYPIWRICSIAPASQLKAQ